MLADEDGQIADAHSISAGLDYPGVGPEHAFLRDSGRARYVGATDEEALDAFRRLTRTEGIIPALEPAHALARVGRARRGARRRLPLRPRRQGSRRGARPVRKEYEREHTAAFFDEIGEGEWTRFEDGRTPPQSVAVHIRELRRFVKAGDRVLDVGAGPGRFTIELAKLGADVVVADISPAAARAQSGAAHGCRPR